MKNVLRGALSLLLCLLMVFSLFPVSAFAGDALPEEADGSPFPEEAAEEAPESPVEAEAEPPAEESAAPAEEAAVETDPPEEAAPAAELSVGAEEVTTAAVFGQNGWVEGDDVWYYYENNVKVTRDWRKISGKWYYFDGLGIMLADDAYKIDGAWYLFDAGGALISKAGWAFLSYTNDDGSVSKTWYYIENGTLVIGWKQLGGKWYYFNPDMYVGCRWTGDRDSLFNEDGVWQSGTGWRSCRFYGSTQWYYLIDSESVTGWQDIAGKRYYLDVFGVMVTGRQEIDGKRYLFGDDGALVRSAWYSHTNEHGTFWYYGLSDGTLASGWQTIGGKRYYFCIWDYMYSGAQSVDGETYFFADSGELIEDGWFGYTVGGVKKWFYIKNGLRFTGWVSSGGERYYVVDGTPVTGDYYTDGQHYIFRESGALSRGGWVKAGDTWLYAVDDGTGYTGWVRSGTDWYYFFDGSMYRDGIWWIDGKTYIFTTGGKLSRGGWQFSQLEAHWYYANSDGTALSGWKKLSGKWYYFDPDYFFMLAGTTKTIQGKNYRFDENGVCLNP